MNTNNKIIPIPVSLPPVAYKQAQKFASTQAKIWKAKQVFASTLAIYAVHSYLKWLQIDSNLEQGNGWKPQLRAIFDVSDLVIPSYGTLECRPVEPNSDRITLPTTIAENCRGLVAVRFPVAIMESTEVPLIEEVELLGFVKPPSDPEVEEIPLTELKSIEDLLDDICLIESWEELRQQEDSTIVSLHKLLGKRESEFLNRLEFISRIEDPDDRNDEVVDYLLADSSWKEKVRNSLPQYRDSSDPNMGAKELLQILDLVGQLWNKLGI